MKAVFQLILLKSVSCLAHVTATLGQGIARALLALSRSFGRRSACSARPRKRRRAPTASPSATLGSGGG